LKTAREHRNEGDNWSNITVRMIQHVLQKQLGLLARRAAKKSVLTKQIIQKRLKFCHNKNWKKSD
jgi:hypothetical protein